MTKIKRCQCSHAWQDRKYGKTMRVHNASNKGDRCTVCGRENA